MRGWVGYASVRVDHPFKIAKRKWPHEIGAPDLSRLGVMGALCAQSARKRWAIGMLECDTRAEPL